VLLTRLVIGDKPLNKLRGKGIALHSQVRFLTRVLPPTLLHRLLMFMHRRSGPSCIFEAGVHPFSSGRSSIFEASMSHVSSIWPLNIVMCTASDRSCLSSVLTFVVAPWCPAFCCRCSCRYPQAITAFCDFSGTGPKMRQNLIRVAKENGSKLGFLS